MFRKIAISLLVVFVLVGCGGGNGGTPPPEPEDNRVDFNGFVVEQINNTAENTDPVEINDTEFVFSEDENAFDSVLN